MPGSCGLKYYLRRSDVLQMFPKFFQTVFEDVYCHSCNSLPCSHQQTFSIATFYRPPATTISFYSTSSPPEKENVSRNRLGPPPPPPPSRGVEKPEGPSALQPTTEHRRCLLMLRLLYC